MQVGKSEEDSIAWPLLNEKIKERINEMKKNDKLSPVYLMILRTLLFTFIGQLISFMTLTHHYLTRSVIKSKNPSVIMILTIFEFLFIGLGMILFKKGKVKRPKAIYIIIAVVYISTIALSLFAYKNENSNHMLIVLLWSLISLSIYSTTRYKAKFSLLQLIGFILAVIGLIMMMSFILYIIFHYEFIFFSDGFLNNFISIIQGILFAAAIVLQELFLKKPEEVYNGLMWIGLSSSGLIAIILLITGDYSIISKYFTELNLNDFLKSSGAVIIGGTMHTITPFYINKCSGVVLCFSLNTQLYWKFVIDMIFEDFNKTLLWNTFGVMFLLAGIGVYLFDQFKTKEIIMVRGPLFDSISDVSCVSQIKESLFKDNKSENKQKDEEVKVDVKVNDMDKDQLNDRKKEEVIKSKENDDDDDDKNRDIMNEKENKDKDQSNEDKGKMRKNTQKIFVDEGDKVSSCSAFSFPSKNEELLKANLNDSIHNN